MTVLALGSSKGGAGKTTLAMCIAAWLARDRIDVTVIDADPNRAISKWLLGVREGEIPGKPGRPPTYEGPPIECFHETDERRLARLIDQLAEQRAFVLIDTAGFANRAATLAMTSSHAVLVPISGSAADVEQGEETIGLVETWTRKGPGVPAVAVLNNIDSRTNLAKHMLGETAKLPRLTTVMSQSAQYKAIHFSGLLPEEGSKPAQEIAALVGELRSMGFLPAATEAVAA